MLPSIRGKKSVSHAHQVCSQRPSTSKACAVGRSVNPEKPTTEAFSSRSTLGHRPTSAATSSGDRVLASASAAVVTASPSASNRTRVTASDASSQPGKVLRSASADSPV